MSASATVRRGALALLVLVALVPAARAQDAGGTDLKPVVNRLDQLERELRTLQRQVYRGEGPEQAGGDGGGMQAPVAARLDTRLGALQQTVQELTGRVETLAHNLKKARRRLDKLVKDVDMRLRALEQGRPMAGAPGGGPETPGGSGAPGADGGDTLGMLGQDAYKEALKQEPGDDRGGRPDGTQTDETATTGQTDTGAGAKDEPDTADGGDGTTDAGGDTPAALYDRAFSLLRKREFDKAAERFKAFLEQYPDHELAGNAKYWLGEAAYARGNYEKAAQHFLKGYKSYPDSGKGPDNLLKLGKTLGKLDRKKEACTVFDRLSDEFPDAPDYIKSRVKTAADNLGCD